MTSTKNRKDQPQILKTKKSKVSAAEAPILTAEHQNSVIKIVLDRFDGRSVILHGIEKTKT